MAIAKHGNDGEGVRAAARLDPAAVLAFPAMRSALLQAGQDDMGAPVRTLYVAASEVSFTDPADFAFAEILAQTPLFAAGEAAGWGGIGWNRTQELLEALLDAGLIVPQADWTAPERHDHRPMADPLPLAPLAAPRCWMDERSLMSDLSGTELDLAWLETVVPVFRTAHVFMDSEGRQVGEANAFPSAARVAVPTEWRGCPYAGNRYQAEKPMNATALKAMRRHWRPMMALLAKVREGYLGRFPAARAGWTVGDVERLTVGALALPSVLLLDCAAPVANGALHPVLSNLFRVTDGLRTVMHQMLFVPKHEPTLAPTAMVDAAMILGYADRNYSFHSDHAVCAGPRFMIEDMLGVVLDGAEPRGGWGGGLPAELDHAVAAIPAAIDYALAGLATYGAVFSLWPAMARSYQRLDAVLATGPATGAAADIAERFADHFAALSHRSFIASEAWRQNRERVYDDMYARAAQGLAAGNGPLLSELLEPGPLSVADVAARRVLDRAIAQRLDCPRSLAWEFADEVMDFLKRGQRILVIAERSQERLRRLLSRPEPRRALSLGDLNLHNVLMGKDVRSVPFLPDELGDVLGLAFAVDARTIEIAPRKTAAASTDPAEGEPSKGWAWCAHAG